MLTLAATTARTGRRLIFSVLLGLLAVLGGCAGNGPVGGGPFPALAGYEGYEVRRVRFAGEVQLPVDSLRAVISTRATRCRLLFLPICIPGTSIGKERYQLELRELGRDVVRLQLYYRDHGYYGTRVVPSVDLVGEEQVVVRFAIAPGDQVMLRELSVEGAEEIVPPAELVESMPLEVGEPFRRIGFLQSADTVRTALLRRGHAYAEVLRNYSIDTIADVAEAHFVALPGPLVYVDTVRFLGNERLSEPTLRRQLTFREGDLLRRAELIRSQRNIYGLEMVSFASVELAPDTLQLEPDSTLATILVRLVEAPQYLVDASVGFGTIDCFRTGGRWLNRNFLGGGRRLEVNGSLSKLGVASPFDAGLAGRGCERSDTTVYGPERVNYRIAANFQQPRLFNTQNQLSVSVHSQRFSELNAYLRESTGGQVTVARGLAERTVLTTTVDVERGRTLASPLHLCIGFEACDEDALALVQQFRWSNALSVAALHDATRSEGPATRGYQLRGAIDWASPLLGSDNRYLRVVGEGTVHRPLRPGWVLSGNLRAGRFLQGSLRPDRGYIPPERRFYAGGPNSVRGYGRNALGPIGYLARLDLEEQDTVSSATGGTQMVVASLELRTPSPFFSDLVRVAYFVDAGHVSVPRLGLGTEGIRITPGAGMRFSTPVGPIRLDVAYNPYPAESGPLYEVDEQGLTLVRTDHQPRGTREGWARFWSSFRIHFAVGQAF